jgi:hypothetical protein
VVERAVPVGTPVIDTNGHEVDWSRLSDGDLVRFHEAGGVVQAVEVRTS